MVDKIEAVRRALPQDIFGPTSEVELWAGLTTNGVSLMMEALRWAAVGASCCCVQLVHRSGRVRLAQHVPVCSWDMTLLWPGEHGTPIITGKAPSGVNVPNITQY